MLGRILKSTLLVIALVELTTTVSAAASAASGINLVEAVGGTRIVISGLNNNNHSSQPLANESFSFDYDFDVQRFLIRFVVEHFNHHTRVNLSGECLESWFRLRANLVRSYYDSIRNKSSYWSLRGKQCVRVRVFRF